MRIRIRHHTLYTYERPLRAAIQHLRLEPRAHGGQRVGRWRVRVDGPGRLRRGEDAFGNVLHTLYLSAPVAQVCIRSEGEVETADAAGVLAGAPEPFAPAVFLRETALTAPDDALRQLSAEAQAAGPQRLDQLHALLRLVADRIRFDTAGTSPATTAAEALAGGRGVCQDMAHAFITAARGLGAPARYVSGHLLRQDTERQEAGHAWAEAHVQGLGWIGFDPANRRCPTDSYVRIACGPDARAVTPIQGVRQGGGSETMTVDLTVSSQDPRRPADG